MTKKNRDMMNQDLLDELEFLKELLAKSGFFSAEEILEILEDQFIEEDIDLSGIDISFEDSSNENFSKLEEVFDGLAADDIIAIHNCGYDIGEGVSDAFELHVHLLNNKFQAQGFCFYTFEDVEDAIFDQSLKITFGDFENDEKKALEIGKVIAERLDEHFNVNWDESVNSQIEINPFVWDKSYDSEKEYEMEGAYESYTSVKVLK